MMSFCLKILMFVVLCSPSLEAAVFGGFTDLVLKITGNVDEDHYHPGDQITIEVGKKNPMDTGNIAKVWFQIGLEEYQDSQPPYTVTFTVPENELGELNVYILTETKDGERSEVEQKIKIEIKESLVEVKLIDQDRNIEIEGLGITHQLHVRGTYADGKKRSITRYAYGTQYLSADPLIAAVSKDGQVKSKGYGQTEIIVRNGNYEARSSITVIPFKDQ